MKMDGVRFQSIRSYSTWRQRECWESVSSAHWFFHLSVFGESTKLITLRLAIKMIRLYSHQVLCDRRDGNDKHQWDCRFHILSYTKGVQRLLLKGQMELNRLDGGPHLRFTQAVWYYGDRHKNPVCCIAFGPRAAGCTPLSYTIVRAGHKPMQPTGLHWATRLWWLHVSGDPTPCIWIVVHFCQLLLALKFSRNGWWNIIVSKQCYH